MNEYPIYWTNVLLNIKYFGINIWFIFIQIILEKYFYRVCMYLNFKLKLELNNTYISTKL